MGGKSGDRQYAALPYRKSKKRGLEVMLVTSRETRRWIIPKGWPIAGVEPHDLAALEAMEEAGLRGKICEKPIGTYHYDKKRDDGSIVNCTVHTFMLEVERQMLNWPEQKQRKTQWFAPEEAAMQVQEPELRELIKGLDKKLARKLEKKLAKKLDKKPGKKPAKKLAKKIDKKPNKKRAKKIDKKPNKKSAKQRN